jgi:hypothetical protein
MLKTPPKPHVASNATGGKVPPGDGGDHGYQEKGRKKEGLKKAGI